MTDVAAFLRGGRIDEARALAMRLVQQGRGGDAMLEMAAMLAAGAGDAAQAVNLFDKLVFNRPNDPVTLLNLARALTASGQFARIGPVLRTVPASRERDQLAGFAVLQLGHFQDAHAIYSGMLAAYPNDPDTLANFAAACLALLDFASAISSLEQAITLRPQDVRLYLALVTVLERASMPDQRRKVAADAVALAPENAEAQHALGLAEAALDNASAAEAALRKAIALAPAQAASYIELGLLLEYHNRLDDLDTLIETARRHLGHELRFLEGWAAVRAKRFEVAAHLAAGVPSSIHATRRAHLHGEIARHLGHVDEAFHWFKTMNRTAMEMMPPPPPGPTYRQNVEAAISAVSRMRRSTATESAAPVPPIFIVGFPRSGTTLLDVILGRLKGTTILEERPLLPVIEREIGSVEELASLGPSEIEAARRRYTVMLEALVPSASAQRIIDKNPLHMARMPLIDRLFPGAPILFVERHPCDVVLSCFFANFRLNHAMRSFTDIEEAARTYDAVFTLWSESERRLPLNVHRVRYEHLVTDPEAEVHAALDFLGVPFDPAIMDSSAAARARGHISTASYAQVQEPIYQHAVARWKRYRRQLEPVMPILEPWIARLGYTV